MKGVFPQLRNAKSMVPQPLAVLGVSGLIHEGCCNEAESLAGNSVLVVRENKVCDLKISTNILPSPSVPPAASAEVVPGQRALEAKQGGF